jgi:hypothetical protein
MAEMEDRDSPTVPGSAMLAMETLMELDAQRAPQTAQLHPGSTRTVSATAYYRKHKRCVPLHDQLVQVIPETQPLVTFSCAFIDQVRLLRC